MKKKKFKKYQEIILPVQCFIKEAFDALPSIAQNILEQNHDNLFNPSKKYKELIYTTPNLFIVTSISAHCHLLEG